MAPAMTPHSAQTAWLLCITVVLLGATLTVPVNAARSEVNRSGLSGYVVILNNAPSVVQKARLSPSVIPRIAGFDHKIDFHSSASLAHAALLERVHTDTLDRAGIAASRKYYSYTTLENGFAAALTPREAEALRADPTVASVRKSEVFRAHTSHTPSFLNLPSTLWSADGGQKHAGEGIVIGVVDTGIWIDSPAFFDNTSTPYGPPPKSWRGACNATKEFPSCNKKVIGANYFKDGFEYSVGAIAKKDSPSPLDVDGHGSHTASTAAGNAGYPVGSKELPAGLASGMAPRARIAAYKVIWYNEAGEGPYGESSDIFYAIDRAVSDGVDVINFSVGGGPADFWEATPLAFFNTLYAGVVNSCSAGNDGDTPDVLSNAAPWQLTVAATTHDRSYRAVVKLQNGKSYAGQAYNRGTGPKALPLVFGAAIVKAKGNVTNAELCIASALDPAKVKGKLVICLRGVTGRVEKGQVAARAGAAGMVLADAKTNGNDLIVDLHALPAAIVGYADGQAIIQYAKSAKSPQGSILPMSTSYGARAPAMAAFSTRGPLKPGRGSIYNYVLKPDIAGPGVNIWAAYSGRQTLNGKPLLSNVLSGTSMAAPHLAGLAALVKQKYPRWSPFAIKSAIMTTASHLDNKKLPIQGGRGAATPFEYGSGQVNPARVLDPGLVYDSSDVEMVSFLLGVNATMTREFFGDVGNVPAIHPANLNVPNLAAPGLRGSLAFRRVVRSVATAKSTYRAVVAAPAGAGIQVVPSKFTILPGQEVTFKVVFSVRKATLKWSFGSLTWTDGKHSVRSVLAAEPVRL